MRTSEYVALGHPDKVADYISEYVLDRFLEKDSNVRYALEVQIKNQYVTLGGEITSEKKYLDQEIEKFVREAVDSIGYDADYQDFWGKENTICGKDLEITLHISQQSPDIACGVNHNGWGDQGIFWGYAENCPEFNHMPKDHALAREIANELYQTKIAGLDIKTQVTLDDDDKIMALVVAIPCKDKKQRASVAEIVELWLKKHQKSSNCEVIVNGTGEYIIHGPIGDCGTTGRKLAVDFYGGNSRIGGGSPWTKDGTKADLTLNLFARQIAKANLMTNQEKVEKVEVGISCCIGRSEIFVEIKLYQKNGEIIKHHLKSNVSPRDLIEKFEMKKANYAKIYKQGLFYDNNYPWEKIETLEEKYIKKI